MEIKALCKFWWAKLTEFECLFDTARRPVGVWSFSHNSNQIFSHYPFVLAFFGKNVLLTAKIKNTILVALQSAESLYQIWSSAYELKCKNLQLKFDSWWQNFDAVFLRPVSAVFVSISNRRTLFRSQWSAVSDQTLYCLLNIIYCQIN